ncbi:MAG: S9 family peptidase [Gemmatimonadaceae bacterium]|nr:S9 family peptidase [Gemmatimonadaceae bacterium]
MTCTFHRSSGDTLTPARMSRLVRALYHTGNRTLHWGSVHRSSVDWRHGSAVLVAALLMTACGVSRNVGVAGAGSPTGLRPAISPAGLDAPPLARTSAHVDTVHGVALPDPYRWLEDTASIDARAWVASEERFAAAVLARAVGRDSLTAVYERALRDAPTLGRVTDTPRGLVITRWIGDSPSLFTRAHDVPSERPLRSAAEIAASGEGASMRVAVPSWDGRFLAIGTTQRGDAGAAIAIVDATTGAAWPDRIPDLLTTTSGTRYQVTWLPGERSDTSSTAFFYPRLWPGALSGATADRLSRGRQFLHRLGSPQSSDIAVFGFGVTPAVAIEPEDLATRVHAVPGSRWLIGTVFRSRQNGTEHFAARRTPGDSTVPAWVSLLSVADRAGHPQLRGDTVWVLSRRSADRAQILRRVLGDALQASTGWSTAVAERRGVITTFSVQDDALYLTERDAGAVHLRALPHGDSRVRDVPLPVTGTVTLWPRSQAGDGVVVSVESWATPPRWFRVRDAGSRIEELTIDDGSRTKLSSTLVSDRLEARSSDGTLVPVSLVYDAATAAGKRDGTAPLLIEAYGGFGVATDPTFDPYIQVWTSLGGVYAYAHVRGGGELGDVWHHAATREAKQRSVDDVIGAIDALIARRFTSAGRVAIQGISFGAIVSGLAPLQRPDLFGVALYDVGGPDEIRAAALDPSAARNIAEIGDVDTPAGIRSLRAASPYHMVPTRIALPAMLLHSANDDYNFGTEMLVGKHVARLQAANSGNRPVVWVRAAGGHRWLQSLSPQWAATVTSFLFWQTGVPGYQPPAQPKP